MGTPKLQERVSARMNLNSGKIIVKRRNSEHGAYGETMMETDGPILLRNVEFRVQQKAYQRVVKQGSRDVCAYALGEYIGEDDPQQSILGTDIHYNPFRLKHFHVLDRSRDGSPIPVEGAMLLRIWSETQNGKKVGRMRGIGITAMET